MRPAPSCKIWKPRPQPHNPLLLALVAITPNKGRNSRPFPLGKVAHGLTHWGAKNRFKHCKKAVPKPLNLRRNTLPRTLHTAAVLSNPSTKKVASFLDSLAQAEESGAKTADVVKSIVAGDKDIGAPDNFSEVIASAPESRRVALLDSVAMGIKNYTAAHGKAPTADVIEAAMQQGHNAMFHSINKDGQLLDNVGATGDASESTSLQPNRAVVATLMAISEAIPFAGMLPTDIKSNEAKLAIISHIAGTTYGDYSEGDSFNGIGLGQTFASSSRMVRLPLDGATPLKGVFTSTNDPADQGYCDADGIAVPVLSRRTIIYVNGLIAASDKGDGVGSNTAISGGVTIKGVAHTIAGTVSPDTGVVELTAVAPAFPAGTKVHAQGFVNYEKRPALMPSLIVQAKPYALYANPWRIETHISIDSDSQIRNELGIDPISSALMAVRNQATAERHYLALEMMRSIGEAFAPPPYDLNYVGRSQQMNRGQMWVDLRTELGALDQQMAIRTMDHGITHIYAGERLCANLASMPSEFFKPSGVTPRPGIYRVGRLFDLYDLYYTPKKLRQSADGSEAEMLCIGRSNEVARNPMLLGDAVAPTFMDLAMDGSMQRKAALYARDFTSINPHAPSASAAVLVTVKGLK